MMQTKNRRNLIINTTQMLVWVGVFITPALVTATMTGSLKQAVGVFGVSGVVILPFFVLYCFNYYFLVPKFLHGGKTKWFYIVNAGLVIGWNLYKYFPKGPVEFPQEVVDQFGSQGMWSFYVGGILFSIFFQCLVIVMAAGIRRIMRANEDMVAELTWLKSQLSPHFLFNTLNNISSLTQINPDKAQDSIGQLSDLLRYALYDSEADKVPLQAEMEFMDNYIDLMSLRCNELTTVEKDLQLPTERIDVAPLLFISLIENAFKHGVNARKPSFVHISMYCNNREIVFSCENSLFEKQEKDHIGSGIGIENMRRRLELLYHGRHTYEQTSSNGIYSVKVRLKI